MKTFPPLRTLLTALNLLSRMGIRVKGRTFNVRIDGLMAPIYFRYGTSDISAISQILLQRELSTLEIPAPRWILDCGANIGSSSIFFLNRWPSAKVIAIEADPQNFPLLVRNLAPYGERAYPLLGALDSTDGVVRIERQENLGLWASRISSSSISGILMPSFSLKSIVSRLPEKRADLVKMDIEGAETQILTDLAENYDPASPLFSVLLVETHNPDADEAFQRLRNRMSLGSSKLGEYSVIGA